VEFLETKFANLVTQIGPLLIRVFGVWPIIDWQAMSIFNKPETATDSSLAPLPMFVLMHLSTLKDLVAFFTIIFPDYVTKHAQFSGLTATVLSDCAEIAITRTVKIQLSDILRLFERTGDSPPAVLLSTVNTDAEIKDSVSHNQRIVHLTHLLRDVVDIARYDIGYLPTFLSQILPLLGFAHYELRAGLWRGQQTPQLATLLGIVIELVWLFCEHREDVSRFFLYNIATFDVSYMRHLISTFSTVPERWQDVLMTQLAGLNEELATLDLEAFDSGTTYDCTPFLVTANRICYQFNRIKVRNRAAFLNPVFEHLSVTVLHVRLFQDCLGTLLEYCPLHEFWAHASVISGYAKGAVGGLHLIAQFLRLFSFFNCDDVALTILKSERVAISQMITSLRADLLGQVQATILRYFARRSRTMKIAGISHYRSVFKPNDLATYFITKGESAIGKGTVMSEPNFREGICQVRELVREVPTTIPFFSDEVPIADYIATNLTNSLTSILFRDAIADAQWLDRSFATAADVFWPICTLLGASFPRKLYEGQAENAATFKFTSFLEYTSLLASPGTPQASTQVLIGIFEERVSDFIQSDCMLTLFRPYGLCFDHIQRLGPMKYRAEDFFSVTSFRFIIQNLGIDAAFCLDKILIQQAVRLVVSIFATHDKLEPQIVQWDAKWREHELDWVAAGDNPQMQAAAEDLVRLGVVISLRSLLREAASQVVDQTTPGLTSILRAGLLRTEDRRGQKDVLIEEMLISNTVYRLIEIGLSSKAVKSVTDTVRLFFYFGLLLLHSGWTNLKFYMDHESMDKNLHLVPVAMDCIMALLRFFSGSTDQQTLSRALQRHLAVLHVAITLRRRDPARYSRSGVNTFIILVDLYPKKLTSVEYGRIGATFPTSVVQAAYKEVQDAKEAKQIAKHKHVKGVRGKKIEITTTKGAGQTPSTSVPEAQERPIAEHADQPSASPPPTTGDNQAVPE
jgi:hypothetical protein